MIVAKPPSSTGLEEIRERFAATGASTTVLAARTTAVDRAVIAAFTDLLAPAFPGGIALLAVGGYGRRELFPQSDVDLLLLAERTPAGAATGAISEFLRVLWDSGLRLSHSVRTPKECCELHEQNAELSISLLDERFLAGDRVLYNDFAARAPRFIRDHRRDLIRRLCQLTRVRHAKYENTIYHLEPNVKEAPGAMRDLHLLGWLNQLRDEGVGAEPSPDLELAREFLSTLRCFLHFRAGRDDNVLSFDAQEEFAAQPFLSNEDPGESMRRYYLHTREVHRAARRALDAAEGRNSSLLRGFRRWRSRLSNAEFTVSRERVFFKSPQTIPYDPELVMRLFQFAARHGFALAPETERRIGTHLPAIEKHYAGQKPHWAALLEILALPHSYPALVAMHETGVLRVLFPEWRRIECLVVRDFYHRYTVDEHSLLAIKRLEDLRDAEDPGRRRFATLLDEIEELAVLNLALLFHDIGKGEGDGTHAARSAAVAAGALERIQLPVRKRSLVLFLIENHLELSAAMSGRDLDDPATAQALAAVTGTVERLKSLTLMTFADISAVNPTAMSPWRLEQLWMLYLATYNELTRALDADRIHTPAVENPEIAAFLKGFPVRYLRTRPGEEIKRHFELARRCEESGAAIHVEQRGGVYELAVVAKDRPYLLASLAGALASFGVNIVKAEAFSNGNGRVLDTFNFEDPSRNFELNPSELDRLRFTLERVALGRLRARDLLKSRRLPRPPSKGSRIEPRVSFNNGASEQATLIEVIAEDRPGLLYQITRALSEAGCNIEVVLIATEAHKAIDVIYVTHEGGQLGPAITAILKKELLEIGRAG